MQKKEQKSRSLIDRFLSFSEEKGLIRKGEKVLLAVSGGIDSMVMAHLFLAAGIPSSVAHCNFRLRGAESDMDEDLVREFAEKNNLQFHSAGFDTADYSKKNNISVQMAARELRYKWFEELRAQYGYGRIAVAHNLNDSIETMIINLTRGTGLTGLSGIRVSAGAVIRPLLFASRKEIAEYCIACGIVYREDKSNNETKYTRNKIRIKVIPVLKEINPSIEDTLAATAGILEETDMLLNDLMDAVRSEVSREEEGKTIFDIRKLNRYKDRRTLLFELFSPFGVRKDMLDGLYSLIPGKTGASLITNRFRLIKNRNELIIIDNTAPESTSYIVAEKTDFGKIPFLIPAIVQDRDDNFIIPADSGAGCFDSDKIKYPVILRKWKKGDRFHPFGMNRNKKLSDYFTDRKFSLPEKEHIYVMESDGKIAWIVGERIDNRFRITDETRQTLILKVRKRRE